MDEVTTCFLCSQPLKRRGWLTRRFGSSGRMKGEAQEHEHHEPAIEVQDPGRSEVAVPLESSSSNGVPDVEYLKEEARVHIRMGRYQEAVEICNRVLSVIPDDADGYYNRGLAYLRMEDYRRAIQEFEQVTRLNPNAVDSRINRGLALLTMGQPREALQAYDEIVKLDPENAAGYNGRGAAYFDQGQFERSIREFDTAIGLDPRLGYAYSNRAMSHIRLGRYEEAERDINRATDLGVDVSDAAEELNRAR